MAIKPFPHEILVTVFKTLTVAVPQLSLATGVSNVKLAPPAEFVLFAAQVILGGVVSTMAMVWLQVLVLPERSVATHVRVATNVLPQPRFVLVLSTETVTGPHVSLAVGSSKLKLPTPHSLVLFPTQLIVGLVVSTNAIV